MWYGLKICSWESPGNRSFADCSILIADGVVSCREGAADVLDDVTHKFQMASLISTVVVIDR